MNALWIQSLCAVWVVSPLWAMAQAPSSPVGQVRAPESTGVLSLMPGIVERSDSGDPKVTPTQSPEAPAVSITIDEAGNLILQSTDAAALDRLEEIMRANRPPRRPYDIFKVKHARASWVKLNLDEYFEDEENGELDLGYYFFGFEQNKKKDGERQLGSRPPLRFIADNDTNSIVVQGADENAKKTIKELIELWDVPEPNDEDNARYTRLIKVRFSRADSIANTIKEAYRDLLSANDKTFQAGDEEKREGSPGGGVQAGGGMSFAFKGKLSVGVDAVTNSILISAEGKPLLNLVCEMVEELDVAAQREGNMEVYHLPPSVNGKSVREALTKLLATPKQNQQAQQQPQDPNATNPDVKAALENQNRRPNRGKNPL